VTSQITQDGYAHANDFGGNDVFVMGKETDDWSFQGKEIIGSNNGGDSFKLGNDLAAGNTPNNNTNGNDFVKMLLGNFVNDLMSNWNQNLRPNNFGTNPYNGGLFNTKDNPNNKGATTNNTNGLWSGSRDGIRYDRPRHQREMRQAFRLFGEMFNVMARLAKLSDQMSSFRNRGTMYA
jgi:hypothetical protein